jgi:uncharacterized protein (DUF2384 family)
MNKQKKTNEKIVDCSKDKIDGLEVSAIATKIWNDRIIAQIRIKKEREDSIIKRAVALFEILDIGLKALGTSDKLYRWLTSPNRVLGNKIPLKMMIDDKAELVRDELIRIGHGLFA